MDRLSALDYSVISGYLLALLCLGFYLSRRASRSLEDYFLGGRQLPWWALGISGMASFLDVAGTVLIVSFLFMLGPRGMFIEFRGGAVLILPVLLLWTGKWNRRSNCMTGAEWMVFRFGERAGGQFARVVTAVAVMIAQIGGLAYMVKGVGLFLSTFLPFSPLACAAIMLGVATLYTMISGFYGVVYTDMFQSLIILSAVIGITIMAVLAVGRLDGDLTAFAQQVTAMPNWTSAVPHTLVAMPAGYEDYNPLLMFAVFYLLKNVIQGAGMGHDAKYYGARNERECGTLTFLWTILITVRWPMMIGFAVLGLFMVNKLVPDQAVLAESAALVKSSPEIAEQFGEEVEQKDWERVLSAVAAQPQNFPTLSAQLADDGLLGSAWPTKLKLLSFHGNVNPERILSTVLLTMMPIGFRGLLLVALLAASMSTFDTGVNQSAAYFTRDIYQNYWRRRASNRELMLVTYAFILFIVGCGFGMGYFARNINSIWAWITMGLGGGMLVPGLLKFYWWRFNAGGVVVGILFGMTAAVLDHISRTFHPTTGLHLYIDGFFARLFPGGFPTELSTFLYLVAIGTFGAILGTYLTPPTDARVLDKFYRATRPFGLWGPLKSRLPASARAHVSREHRNDLIALPFTLAWQITMFLLPMLAIVGNWQAFWPTLAIFLTGLAGMYLFWYRNLPPAEAGVLNDIAKLPP